jgi:hypothetical protein
VTKRVLGVGLIDLAGSSVCPVYPDAWSSPLSPVFMVLIGANEEETGRGHYRFREAGS